jgi:mannose-6-phosphate isomerase-like protein (cupin superfamily)
MPAMRQLRTLDFTGRKAWDALALAEIEGASVKVHWTDQPYRWHVNDGKEVFLVLDGTVHMHHRVDGEERIAVLEAGHAFIADAGDEHMAAPQGAARILVVEKIGSD